MKLFKRKEEKRSIEDILMPKEIDVEEPSEDVECEDIEDECEEIIDDVETDIMCEVQEEMKDNALCCFGWEEVKTEKWLIKSAKIWYAIMSFIWFLFGGLTFAPIIFIANKINVIFKNKKKSLFVATMIYCGIVALIIIISIMRKYPILDE